MKLMMMNEDQCEVLDNDQLVAIDDEVSKIMCMSFVNINNDHSNSMNMKISKSAEKRAFFDTFHFFDGCMKIENDQ